MSESTYPPVTRSVVEARRGLAPEIEDAFRAFSQKVFADQGQRMRSGVSILTS